MRSVLHVFLDGRTGGPLIRVLAVTEVLRHEGWRFVMALPRGGDFKQQLQDKGYSVYEVSMSNPHGFCSLLKNLRWIMGFPLAAWHLCRIIRREQISIVHLHGLMAVQGATAARLCGCRIVWHLSSCFFPQRVARFVMRLVRRWSDCMIIISESLRTYHFGSHDSHDPRVRVIQNCVDTDLFRPDRVPPEAVDECRKRFGIAPGDPIVGTVGNVNPIKDYETLVEAASLVIPKIPGTKFVIVGALLDTQETYLRRLRHKLREKGIEDAFVFLGRLSLTEIPVVLAMLDVFVFTSKAEGGPQVTMQAMALEKPVVSTRVGDVPYQIRDGDDGYIVDVADSQAVAEHVIQLLRDPARRMEIGRNARKKIVARFAIGSLVGGHRRVYASLAERHTTEDVEQMQAV